MAAHASAATVIQAIINSRQKPNSTASKMTWQQEFWSWMTPSYVKTAEPPAVGQKAPSTPKLTVPKDGKPTIIAFLRHCGCPCKPNYLLQYAHVLMMSSRREDFPQPA